jgi:hypothetical protein
VSLYVNKIIKFNFDYIQVNDQNITSCRNFTQKYKYAEECDKKRGDNECDNTKGLVCPSTTNTCNCPVLSSTIFCDCNYGTYWDYDEDKCGNITLLSKQKSRNIYKLNRAYEAVLSRLYRKLSVQF